MKRSVSVRRFGPLSRMAAGLFLFGCSTPVRQDPGNATSAHASARAGSDAGARTARPVVRRRVLEAGDGHLRAGRLLPDRGQLHVERNGSRTALHDAARRRGVSGGVYMGVGPEQNFTYIAAIRPKMAFIVDIRRQAVMQHLMFKAMFEMANDRADFISILFAKPRPAGLDSTTSIQKMWEAYRAGARPTRRCGAQNYARVVERLTKTHGFTLHGRRIGAAQGACSTRSTSTARRSRRAAARAAAAATSPISPDTRSTPRASREAFCRPRRTIAT